MELVQLPSSSWDSFAEWSRDLGGRAPLSESKRNTSTPRAEGGGGGTFSKSATQHTCHGRRRGDNKYPCACVSFARLLVSHKSLEKGVGEHILQICHGWRMSFHAKARNASVMRRGDPKLEMHRSQAGDLTDRSMIVPGRLSLIGSHVNDFH